MLGLARLSLLHCVSDSVGWHYPEQHSRVAQVHDEKYPENPTKQENAPSKPARLGQLPIEWIIGPYIPVQEQLEALSNAQRCQIYTTGGCRMWGPTDCLGAACYED
jgi:hypothetical protein